MKNKVNRVLAAILCFALVFAAESATAFAAAPVAEKPSEFLNKGPAMPLGTLTEEEIRQLERENVGYCNDCPAPRHASIIAHRHEIVNTYNAYTGYRSAGQDDTAVVVEVLPGQGSGSLSFSKTIEISNGWNATIEFSSDVVSASVGYDVTFTGSDTATWESEIPDGYGGRIKCWHTYAVEEFNLKTIYYPPYGAQSYEEVGTGASWQWLYFSFERELIPPPEE